MSSDSVKPLNEEQSPWSDSYQPETHKRITCRDCVYADRQFSFTPVAISLCSTQSYTLVHLQWIKPINAIALNTRIYFFVMSGKVRPSCMGIRHQFMVGCLHIHVITTVTPGHVPTFTT